MVEELSASLWDLHRLDAMDEWLANFQSLFFANDHPTARLGSEPITTTDSSYHVGIYIGSHQLSSATGSTRVYGEYHHGAAPISSTDDDEFLHFAARALRVFNAQPARHFLHAFLLRGKTLELWVFDRSGAYSSGVLDIARDPSLPLRVLAGYGMMSDQESGMKMLIKSLGPEDGNYILPGRTPKLFLQPKTIAAPDYLVGLGTVCFAASASAATEPTTVVKFSTCTFVLNHLVNWTLR